MKLYRKEFKHGLSPTWRMCWFRVKKIKANYVSWDISWNGSGPPNWAHYVCAKSRRLALRLHLCRASDDAIYSCTEKRFLNNFLDQALIGGYLWKKYLDLFSKTWISLERKVQFQNSWNRVSIHFILHRPNVRNCINEKGSYCHYLAEPRQ
jgi:hypothetical protein